MDAHPDRASSAPDRFDVRITDPAELAAALPHLLGFRPQESVVLLSLRGQRRNRVGLTVRADIPRPDAADLFARSLATAVRSDHPRAVLVAVVSDAPDVDRGWSRVELPHRPLVGALVAALAGVGLAVPDVLLVRRDRWWSYDCPHPCCEPGAGSPLPAGVTDLELASLASGQVLAPDRAALSARIARPAGSTGDATALYATHDRTAAVAAHGADAVAEETWQEVTAALAVLRPGANGGLSDAQIARIVSGLLDRDVRDRALNLALGPDAGTAELLWTECTRRAPAPLDAVPATLLAVCAWLRGDGAMANVALERARDSDPGYGLARLLETALASCLPPAELRAMLTATAPPSPGNRRRGQGR